MKGHWLETKKMEKKNNPVPKGKAGGAATHKPENSTALIWKAKDSIASAELSILPFAERGWMLLFCV